MDNNENKNTFVFFDYWCILLLNLPTNESGELIQAICDYRLNKEVKELSPQLNAVFMMIKAAMDKNESKYADICEKNRVNGSKAHKKDATASERNRALPIATERKRPLPSACDKMRPLPIATERKPNDNDNDNDYDNENDNDYDYEHEFLKKEEKEEKKIIRLEPDEIEKRLTEVLSYEDIFINKSNKKINEKLFEDKYRELYPGDYIGLLQVENAAMDKEHNYSFPKKF